MMNLSPSFLISGLFLLVSIPLQVYLFRRGRGYIRDRIKNDDVLKKLTFTAGCCFVLLDLPLAWRVLFGPSAVEFSSPVVRAMFTLSSIWAIGSTGSAAIVLAYKLLQRLILLPKQVVDRRVDAGRRQFLRGGVGMAAAAPFVVSGYGAFLERRRFVVDHLEIPVDALASQLAHLTVVQLTDIHVGPFMAAEELARYVEAVNQLKPDLIALTGDFIASSTDEVEPCVTTLAKLKARYGAFACIGNHDIHARADKKLARLLAENGIQTLRNDAVSISIGGAKLSLLGIDDLRSGHPDLPHALRASETDPMETKILLSHRPEIFSSAASAGIDLVLSGHYHGGQVKLGLGPESLSIARLLTPYAEGLFQLKAEDRRAAKRANLFVSRGVGITALPVRINCPPQIAHLTLKKA
jgi:predicted MPP superfamily phosphohydrolase